MTYLSGCRRLTGSATLKCWGRQRADFWTWIQMLRKHPLHQWLVTDSRAFVDDGSVSFYTILSRSAKLGVHQDSAHTDWRLNSSCGGAAEASRRRAHGRCASSASYVDEGSGRRCPPGPPADWLLEPRVRRLLVPKTVAFVWPDVNFSLLIHGTYMVYLYSCSITVFYHPEFELCLSGHSQIV
jgi:hypothetical protein